MELDAIEDCLDCSAPPVGAPLADARVRAMMRTSKKRARTGPRQGKLRAGATIGVAAALLAGAGVSVAQTIDWGPQRWLPRYETPDASFSTTLPSGRACEVRAIAVAADGNDRTGAGVDPRLRDWLRQTDLKQVLDLPAARAEDSSRAASSADQTVELGPEGLLMDVQKPPSTRTPDDVEANIIQLALQNAILKEATSLKLDLRISTFNAVIKCDPVTQ